MDAATKSAEIGDARKRAQELVKRGTIESAARRMAAEFHLCVYASQGEIYGSYYETDKAERVHLLYPVKF